jgi:hypothetical protein
LVEGAGRNRRAESLSETAKKDRLERPPVLFGDDIEDQVDDLAI